VSRLLAALVLIASPAPLQEEGFSPIFDGKTLAGWSARGGGTWSVDGGTILGETGTGTYGWLCSEKKYGDFILEFDAKHEANGNSGIQVRSAIDEKDLMVGYQFDLDRTRPSSGRLYDEARRLLLHDVPANAEARGAFKGDDWNKIRIECIADRLRSWVNGVPIVDWIDSVDLDGILALQVHSGLKDPVKVRFRNLRIKDLGRRTWKPIFDGKTLAGWEKKGSGWTAEEGAISGRCARADSDAATLATALPSGEFTVRFRFKDVQACGLTLAVAADGSGVLAPRDNPMPKPYREGWNAMTVSARGSQIVTHLNDLRVSAVATDVKRTGRLVLALPGGRDVAVLIKDLEILGDAK
jgi:3-keto-disaccharide hydrolase